MINIQSTINTANYKRFNELRYLADYNPKAAKKIFYAVLLNDMLLWAHDRNEPQSIQKRLLDILKQFLIKNCEFTIITSPDEQVLKD